MKITAVAILASLAVPAAACLWDNDTLRAEAKGLPGIAEIITGRFERNPPLYYEMRLKRSSEQVQSKPRDWEAYDNAGVACDRLARHDEAIQWMARKKVALDAAAGEGDSRADHQYRYLANLGTFHAHRWFGRGANRDDLADLKQGIELIEAAIDLNPEAHFGRERYQLMAMRWILNPPEADFNEKRMTELPSFFHADPRFLTLRIQHGQRMIGNLSRAGLDDAVQGLIGLIALGNAWESVDVHYALMLALADRRDSALAHLVKLRCLELIRSGKTSLHPDAPTGEELIKLIDWTGFIARDVDEIDLYFAKARSAADAWHQQRTTFMLERLSAGRHPDFDSNFWADYTDVAAAKVPNGLFGVNRAIVMEMAPVVFAAAVTMLMLIGAIRLMRRIRRARAVAAVT